MHISRVGLNRDRSFGSCVKLLLPCCDGSVVVEMLVESKEIPTLVLEIINNATE